MTDTTTTTPAPIDTIHDELAAYADATERATNVDTLQALVDNQAQMVPLATASPFDSPAGIALRVIARRIKERAEKLGDELLEESRATIEYEHADARREAIAGQPFRKITFP